MTIILHEYFTNTSILNSKLMIRIKKPYKTQLVENIKCSIVKNFELVLWIGDKMVMRWMENDSLRQVLKYFNLSYNCLKLLNMPDNVINWTFIIDLFYESGYVMDTIKLFNELFKEGLCPILEVTLELHKPEDICVGECSDVTYDWCFMDQNLNKIRIMDMIITEKDEQSLKPDNSNHIVLI